MIAHYPAAVILLAGSTCLAQSYLCGYVSAPGAPTITQYTCSIPGAQFSQTGTWEAVCWKEPEFGGLDVAVGSGSISASGFPSKSVAC
jgi:hypothetical protein